MSLDLFAKAARNTEEFAAARPLPDMPATFTEGFTAAWNEAFAVTRSDAEGLGRYQRAQTWLDEYQEATGERIRNPELLPSMAQGMQWQLMQDRYAKLQTQRPDLKLSPPPTLDDAERSAVARGQTALKASQEDQNRPQTWGSSSGRFLGAAGAAVTDPINAASMLFGAGAAGGILRTALVEGAVGGASQAAIAAGTYDYRTQVDPNFGVGDALGEVGVAAAGGAILGGGFKGLAAAWTRARTGQWPRYVQDAGNVAARAALTESDNPFVAAGVVGEMAHRQRLAAAEDALASGRPVELPQDMFSSNGWRPSRVYDAEGRDVGVQYEVVEARDLIASNNADFSPNPAYPADLQPRDRTRPITQDQVNGIAARLQPERLGPSQDASTGAPIIGPDGVVESGNGRVLALRRAYDEDGANANSYRNFIRSQGFDIEGMSQPVLIARRTSELAPDHRVAFTAAANRANVMRLSATEQALADARLLDQATLDALQPGDVGSAGNRDFVRAFMGRLPRAEQGALMDADGVLSQEGSRRINAALMGRAYGDASLLGRVLEDDDSNIRALGGALADAAGRWTAMREAAVSGRVPTAMDITDDLLAAMRLVQRARDTGVKLGELVDQLDFVEAPTSTTRALLGFMFRDGDLSKPASRRAVADALAGYAEEALKNTTDARLFDGPLSQADVLGTSLRKAGRDDLTGLVEERLKPEAIEAAMERPDVNLGVVADFERTLREEDVMMPSGDIDADGNEIMVSARDLYRQLDEQTAAAREIEGCAMAMSAQAAQGAV